MPRQKSPRPAQSRRETDERGIPMKDKAYAYMDWPAVEGIVYSDTSSPKSVLSPRAVREGTLYQCFFPGAAAVSLKETRSGKTHRMVCEDEAGYFACVLPAKKPVPHTFLVDGEEKGDPYGRDFLISPEEESRFIAGIDDSACRYLGAHVREDGGETGVLFAVWAPNALRVSVVGPFNNWDGRALPMERHEESGIFELFVPGLGYGIRYQYELKLPTGLVYTRPDPCGFSFEAGNPRVSTVTESVYHWNDAEYLGKRKRGPGLASRPVSILECSLEAWRRKEEDPGKADYRYLAMRIAAHVRKMGFTHVELRPVMEYADEASGGYQTTGYFAPTSRYGKPDDFRFFVDTMHGFGIGVILDWTPAGFSPDTGFLASFDGTGLYEHIDPKQGVHPVFGTRLFNHGRPEVRSFLLSDALFWMREYHADGLRLDGCSTMLRLDYARGGGQWVPNIYGESENLEGMEFLRRLSGIFHRSFPDGILILEESVDQPDVTAPSEDGGLGFDFKWNLHFTQDVLRYLAMDSPGRRNGSALLQNGMLHNYLDRFVISLSRGIGSFDRHRFLAGVDGTDQARAALVRAVYAYLFCHPGKKLLADGEVFGTEYFARLLSLYRDEPALSAGDYSEAGFEWINTMDTEHSVLAFLRKNGAETGTLLVACNFSDEYLPACRTGVPYPGRYREILNSDAASFGGSGKENPEETSSESVPCDERSESIVFRIAPRSAAVFRYLGK